MGQTASAWSESIALDRARQGLVAAGAFRRLRRAWNPLLHPRGANGRFIEKGGRVKWRDRDSAQMWRVGDVLDITSKGSIRVRDTDGNVAIRDPKSLYTVPTPKARINPNSWKQVGAQAGSNPGGFFEDPNQDKWYVKTMSPDRVSNEVAATRLYELAGATVPEVTSSPDGKKFVTRIENSDDFSEIPLSDRPDALEAVAKDFVVDAWLANWDAPHNDNIRFNEMGDAMRVDTGGSLDYRARGAKKGSAFGPVVGELKTMREFQGRKNPVYAGVTKEHEEDGARRILAIHPDEIRETVKDNGLPSTVADTLIARRAYLANHYGYSLPETTPEGKAILAQAAANAGDGSASSVAVSSAPTPSVAPKASVPAQRPSMLSAVKKTDPNAMPFAPDSPVWLTAKLDEAKGQGEIWTIKTIAADKTSLDIESNSTKKVITVTPADVKILRSNLTTPETFYSDGKTIPEIGDRVQTPKHGTGTIDRLFHKYSRITLDDGGRRINVLHKLTKLDNDDDKDVTPTADTATPNASATPAAPKKPRARKNAIPGEEFDVEGHDWVGEPHPKVYDMVNGRETQAVMLTRTPAGKINGVVVSMDDDLGETMIISPKKVRKAGTLTDDDYQNWVNGIATDGSTTKAPAAPAHVRRQDAINAMDEKAAKALKPKPIAKSIRSTPPSNVVDYGTEEVKDEFKEYYEMRPGDELFQVQSSSRRSAKAHFLRRDGKMHFLGGSAGIGKSYEFDAIRRKTPDQDVTEDFRNFASSSGTYGGSRIINITPPEFAKAAEVLKTDGPPSDVIDGFGKFKASDGKFYDPFDGVVASEINDLQVFSPQEIRTWNTFDVSRAHFDDTEFQKTLSTIKKEKVPTFLVVKHRDSDGGHSEKWDAYVAGYDTLGNYDVPSQEPTVLAPDKRIKLTEEQKAFYFTATPGYGTNKSPDIRIRIHGNSKESDLPSLPEDQYLKTESGEPYGIKYTKHITGPTYRRDAKFSTNQIVDSAYAQLDEKLAIKNPNNYQYLRFSSRQGTLRYRGFPKASSEVPIPNTRVTSTSKKDDVITSIDTSALKPGEKVPGFGSVWTERQLTPMEAFTGKIDANPGDLENGRFDDLIFRTAMRDTFGPKEAIVADDGSTQKDPAMYEFTKHIHGDAVPLKLPTRAFNQYVKNGPGVKLFRGIVGEEFQRDFRYGTLYQGYGAFGNGTYSSTDASTARMYANQNRNWNSTRGASGGGVTNLAIKHNARIVEQDDVITGMNKMISKTSDDILADLSKDGLMPSKATLESVGADENAEVDPDFRSKADVYSSRGYLKNDAMDKIRDKTVRQASEVKRHLESKGLVVTDSEYKEDTHATLSNFRMVVENPSMTGVDKEDRTMHLSVGNINIFKGGYGIKEDQVNLIIGLRHSPKASQRRRTQFHNYMSLASTPSYGTDPVRSVRALAIMKGVDIGVSTPEYFDDNGNLVKNKAEFDQNKARLSVLNKQHNDNRYSVGEDGERKNVGFYDPQDSFYSEDIQRFYSENLPTMKKISRLQFGSENGRYAAANGIDVIRLARGYSEQFHVFTNRNSIVMEKNW